MRKSAASYYLVFLYISLSLGLFFLDGQGFFSPFKSFMQSLATPVQVKLLSTRRAGHLFLGIFSSKVELKKKISLLEEENRNLSSLLGKFSGVLEENEKMRRLLGSSALPTWLFAPARVVSFSGVGMSVLSESSFEPAKGVVLVSGEDNLIFVGRVSEMAAGVWRVDLPAASSARIPVLVRGRESSTRRASGILVGDGSGVKLTQVLTKEDIASGDFIYTSGDGGFPPDILVGTVGNILPVREETFREAEVEVPLDYGSLDYVFFVTKYE